MSSITVPIPYDKKVLNATKKLLELGKKSLLPIYDCPDMIIDRGDGVHLWDVDGNQYIDFSSGLAVCNLGYRHPVVMEAIMRQTEKIWHTTSLYYSEPVILLAEYLTRSSFADYVFFWNSSVAVYEGTLTTVRKYAQIKYPHQNKTKTIILSSNTLINHLKNSEHLIYSPFNDIDAVNKVFSDHVNAVIFDIVDGNEQGNFIDYDFLQIICNLCKKYNALLVIDEVQTAIGRTGKLFAHQWFNVEPDIVIIANGICAGLPFGGLLVSEKVGNIMGNGDYSSALGGNPLAAFVALESLKIINDRLFLNEVLYKETYLRQQLANINQILPLFGKIYGKGLLLLAEFIYPKCSAQDFSDLCIQYGILILYSGKHCIRFSPPLTITYHEIDEFIERLKQMIQDSLLSK